MAVKKMTQYSDVVSLLHEPMATRECTHRTLSSGSRALRLIQCRHALTAGIVVPLDDIYTTFLHRLRFALVPKFNYSRTRPSTRWGDPVVYTKSGPESTVVYLCA